MIFAIFTTIIFIAELIIAIWLIVTLFKIDRAINNVNSSLTELRPKIKSLMELIHAISDQIMELAPIWVENFYKKRNEFLIIQAKKLLISAIFLLVDMKIINKIKRNKILKSAWWGFTLVQNMI